MPTYQYACTECGHAFEAVQSFSDDALTDCPECTGRLRKVFNSVGIVFKGSGFYRTDSRKSAAGDTTTEAPAAKSDAPNAPDSSSTTPKSDTSSTTSSTTSSGGSSAGGTSSSTPSSTSAA